jgi:hypothetical protein
MGKASTNIEDLPDNFEETENTTSQKVINDLKQITDDTSEEGEEEDYESIKPKSKNKVIDVLTKNAVNSILVFVLILLVLNKNYVYYIAKIPFISNYYESDSFVGNFISAIIGVIIFLLVKYLLA